MKNSNLNQIFKLSLKNFFKNGNDFLWFNSKFLTLQKFLSSFYEKSSTIIPSRRTYTVSLSHLVIRSGTTSHNKTSVDKDVQANSSQRDIKARRKANPFDPYTETPSHLQKITTKTFYLWSSIDSKKTLRMRNTFEIYTTTFNFSIHYLLSKKKKNLQKQRSIFPLKRT